MDAQEIKNETVDFWYALGDCRGPIPGFEHMEYSDSKIQIAFDNELNSESPVGLFT